MSNVPGEMLPAGRIGAGPAAAARSTGGGVGKWTDKEATEELASPPSVQGRQAGSARYDSTLGGEWGTSYRGRSSSGGTASSFFTATNKSDKAITGVATATYKVHPPKVGLYFNKMQCFCFEEQRLLLGDRGHAHVFLHQSGDRGRPAAQARE